MAGPVCIIIPTYNNAGTIAQVVEDVKHYADDIIVVNDGCTDDTANILAGIDGIDVVSYMPNRGKGHALKVGFQYALEKGFDSAITMDADGQHYADDILSFLEAWSQNPRALIVGSRNLQSKNMPGKNTFANKFSNFWFHVQTLQNLPDTQTGFRLYPLRQMKGLRWITSRYEAELEMLVFAAWHGVRLVPIKINVFYPDAEHRVTHFRPTYDFFRISVLNTVLCFAAIFYGYPMMLWRKLSGK